MIFFVTSCNLICGFSKLDPEDGGSNIHQTLVPPSRLKDAVTQETKIWTFQESECKDCKSRRLNVAARICSEDGWNTQGDPESLIQYCDYDAGRIAGELGFNSRIGHSSLLHRLQTGTNPWINVPGCESDIHIHPIPNLRLNGVYLQSFIHLHEMLLTVWQIYLYWFKEHLVLCVRVLEGIERGGPGGHKAHE
jgi:hypothetical protein